MAIKSVICPILSDHKGIEGRYVEKTLFMLGDDHIIVFCKKHRWMKVEFTRFGEKIDFTDCSVKITPIKEDYIESTKTPVISVGKFSKNAKHN